jgi:ferritin-like metal-binding protein YciE
MNSKDLVISWLNDAHAMENALIKVLEHRIDDAKDFPAVQEMDRKHLEETRRHAELVKGCIERMGETPSTAKSVMGTIFGAVQAPMTGLARDEVVKNCLMDYAAENFEVASYRALISAANDIGDLETVLVCEQIMQEDLEMANRILDGLPMVVSEQMRRVTTNAKA